MTRTTYTAAPIRAATLEDTDVLWHDGQWRSVMNVWCDENRPDLMKIATADRDLDAILEHLNGRAEYVLVRLLTEKPGDGPAEFEYMAPRACDLVTIQVPVRDRPRDVDGAGLLLSAPELAQYAGRPLSEFDIARIASLVPASGVPRAIADIVTQWSAGDKPAVQADDAASAGASEA